MKMEDPLESQRRKMSQMEEEEETQLQHPQKTRRQGGFRTMPFIIVNESLEKVGSYGLLPNMIMYLMKDYRMSLAKGSNMIFFWTAATNFFPILGAFVADSYLGRFLTIGLGSVITFLGMVLLWLTTMIPHLKPAACNPLAGETCLLPTTTQLAVLVIALLLMSLGAGGVRPCSQAFGADQFDKRNSHNSEQNQRVLETFFNWYYACSCAGVVIALTVIVYIQDHAGYRIGFGVPALLMIVSILVFFMASGLYKKTAPKKSLFTSFAQVAVASFRNRDLILSPKNSNVQYYHQKDSSILVPTDKLRFLNKACVLRDSEKDVCLDDGSAKDPWTLCTVEQVEELKSLIRVIPIWSTSIILSISANQNTFPVIQATLMDRHLTKNFKIPAGSYGTFMIIVIVLWIPLYDRVIIPVASKIKGKPVRISVKVRMGIGLIFSFLAMVTAAIVEGERRRRAVRDPIAAMGMSAMWLVPHFALLGIAEAFNAIGQTEFYYSEFPKSMSSVATALFTFGMGVASLLSSAILSMVNDITRRDGKESWVANNINNGRLDYYYGLLAVLCFVNVIYYVVCAWAYGPCEGEQRGKVTDAKNGNGTESELTD